MYAARDGPGPARQPKVDQATRHLRSDWEKVRITGHELGSLQLMQGSVALPIHDICLRWPAVRREGLLNMYNKVFVFSPPGAVGWC